MWPWEHLAFGYVLYSLHANAIRRERPSGRETIVVAVASQLPDLVDKPLAWAVGFVETGYALGHSIFIAPIVCLAAAALATRRGEQSLGGAFTVGYLSHVAGDVLNPFFLGRGLEVRVLLWPIASPPADAHGGFLEHVLVYLARHVAYLTAEGLTPYLAFQLGLAVAVALLWLYDGAPVASDLWRWLARRAR
ncbi:metal-dependent hydrolase [Natribaculum luteum]|uniref:Metal-dependent hydrolase n=1 Tax=Natribaculum luteum TaxID=1586232 RepID=A0ABD5NZC7_9EURY|nr:metal-dependent hydrolase [Natribaculum luteum]